MAKPRPAPAEEPRRTFSTLPLAQLVPNVTRPAFRKRSPAGADLMAEWPSVVGQRLADMTEPRRLSRGQLTIACDGPAAMELQHLATELVARINTYAGSQVVERLRFVQDRVAPRPPAAPKKPRAQVQRPAGLPEGELGEALANLFAAIKGDGGR